MYNLGLLIITVILKEHSQYNFDLGIILNRKP